MTSPQPPAQSLLSKVLASLIVAAPLLIGCIVMWHNAAHSTPAIPPRPSVSPHTTVTTDNYGNQMVERWDDQGNVHVTVDGATVCTTPQQRRC